MTLKKNIFLLTFIFLFACTSIYAQNPDYAKYRVSFTDKHNTPYSLSVPAAFLSTKAIERRVKFNIPLDSTDLPVNPVYINGVISTGVNLMHISKWFNFISISVPDTSVLKDIQNLPYVKKVEMTYPSFGKKKKKAEGKNTQEYFSEYNSADFSFRKRDSLKFTVKSIDYGFADNQNSMIGIPYLHSLGFKGQGMLIAVLDAGFFRVDNLGAFDSLRLQNRLLGTRNFVEPGKSVFEVSTHGMAVLSTMAGNIPGKIVGTAPKASYWLLRTEDANTEYRVEEDNWIAAAEFADSAGVDIITSSLGYTEFWEQSQSYTYQDLDGKTAQITKGANMATQKGIFVVNSAGNSGASPWKYIGAPADGFNVLSIGAVDESGNIADFSSYGPTSDGRVKPNVSAQGRGTAVINSSNQVVSGNGTSFSGPVVAGAVACLWQTNKNVNNVQLREAIEKSASLYPMSDTSYGYGIPNFSAAYILLSQQTETSLEEPFMLVYPNPFNDELFVIFHSSKNQNLQVEIVDNNGKRFIFKESFEVNSGYSNLTIHNLNRARKGVYILRVITTEKVFTKRIVKI